MYLVYPENHPVEGISIGVRSAFFLGWQASLDGRGILREGKRPIGKRAVP